MEKEIIIRAQKGDIEAFEELYHIYGEYALRVAMAITKDKFSAADVVQETFIRIYKNLEKFDINMPFQPWLYRILINECNRLLKSANQDVSVDELIFHDNMSENDVYKFQEYEGLYKAVQDLEEVNRIPIILKYLKGFKEKEIAEILGVNINTVKSRLYKGRQKLKKIIEKVS